MKRIKIRFNFDGGAEITDGYMYSEYSVIQVVGDEWCWLNFLIPVQLNANDELELDDDSVYKVLTMPMAKLDHAEMESISPSDYAFRMAEELIKRVNEE